jgi:hypothetical protein
MSKRHCNQIVQSAETVREMGAMAPLITSERQARELSRVPAPDRAALPAGKESFLNSPRGAGHATPRRIHAAPCALQFQLKKRPEASKVGAFLRKHRIKKKYTFN